MNQQHYIVGLSYHEAQDVINEMDSIKGYASADSNSRVFVEGNEQQIQSLERYMKRQNYRFGFQGEAPSRSVRNFQ